MASAWCTSSPAGSTIRATLTALTRHGWGGKPIVNPSHDCNNITGQFHVIRTAGWDTAYEVGSWNVENASGATGTIVAQGRCGDIALVTTRPGWDAANNDEQCLIIHSSTPGETRVTFTYTTPGGTLIAGAVIKE